jgi:hypothetical protein
MTVGDDIRATHVGHSRVAQQAIADARRCDELNGRVAVTRVRALLVELGHAAQMGEREPFATRVSTRVVEPVEILERDLAPR